MGSGVQQGIQGKPAELTDIIAEELTLASPVVDPSDPRARDTAASKLASCRAFLSVVGDRVLWGGCEPVKGFDPATYSLTSFEPLVWLKLYASTLMFTGEHQVRQQGALTILEMKAQFRSRLDPGEYPYPFWHSPKKWEAYVNLDSLALVFRDRKIIAAYRIAHESTEASTERQWDGQWQWSSIDGQTQPRVALFSYLFAQDNPHRAQVEETYRRLEAKYRKQHCTSCHSPDNPGKAKSLLILNFPNQSLAARHALVKVLAANEMPPEDPAKNHPAGISDLSVRTELLELAKAFEKEADEAIAFETHKQTSLSRP